MYTLATAITPIVSTGGFGYSYSGKSGKGGGKGLKIKVLGLLCFVKGMSCHIPLIFLQWIGKVHKKRCQL